MSYNDWKEKERKKLEPGLIDKIEFELSHDDALYLIERYLPRKFLKKILQDFEGFISKENLKVLTSYVYSFWKNLTEGKGLIFCGPIGTGKTSAATMLLKYAYGFLKNSEFYRHYTDQFTGTPNPEYMICFWPAVKMLMDYFEDKGLFESKANAIVLVIDDITKVSQEIYKEVFDYVVRNREHGVLPTILTSQMPLKELKDFFGLAIHDIVAANGQVIKLVGQSKRG